MHIVSVGIDKTVRLWDVTTGEEMHAPLRNDKPVFCADFSPDGTRLATACGDNTIRLWDVGTGQEVIELRGHESYVKSVAFMPDGKSLISASGDFTVRVWKAP
jgi:WD40 repeat protein